MQSSKLTDGCSALAVMPDAGEPAKKKARKLGDDGRPIIFARRYTPGTPCHGRTVWESFCDAFAKVIRPQMGDGNQTKWEVSG